jgi:hypothetical protein
MKKLIALIVATLLALSAVAFAETYRSDDITFEYDEKAFEVSLDDRTDDETTVVLHGKNEAWGNTFISFYLRDLEDGEKLPTMEEMSQIPDTTVTQGDWNGYKDVFMYTLEYDDGTSEHFFIAPVMDDDGREIDDMLTVQIGVSKIEDESAAMARDDAISAVVDSLKVDN